MYPVSHNNKNPEAAKEHGIFFYSFLVIGLLRRSRNMVHRRWARRGREQNVREKETGVGID